MAQSQQRCFHEELTQLNSGKVIKASSSIINLNPTIVSGMVGSRLDNSNLSTSHKHPVILDGKDPLSMLLVTTKHISLLHAGPTLLMSTLNATFHILGARLLVRTACRRCITCRRISAATEKQMMGQLPTSRVNPSPPFSHTGMDFAGPFTLKKGHTRKLVLIKAYACVFMCFATKAAHLEVVSDLTTEAFLAALKRFVSRRVCPTNLYSDNGYNVGATLSIPITSYYPSYHLVFHFNPENRLAFQP